MLLALSLGLACASCSKSRDKPCAENCSGSGGANEASGGQTNAGGTETASGGALSDGGATMSASGGNTNQQSGDCEVRLPSAKQQYALWPMSTNPELGLPHPASYVVNDDGTVLDEVTGLMWQSGRSELELTLEKWVEYCAHLDLAGYCNWRAPSRVELASLIHNGDSGSPELQAAEISGGLGWSSNDEIWDVSVDGRFRPSRIEGSDQPFRGPRCVRVVRFDQVEEQQLSLQGEGEEAVIRDQATGLRWHYSNPVTELPQAEAGAHCSALTTDGGGFRLASVKELLTIFDEAHPDTDNLDPEFFPLSLRYISRVAWTASPEPAYDDLLFNFTDRQSYQLFSQVTVTPEDDHLVFCVK